MHSDTGHAVRTEPFHVGDAANEPTLERGKRLDLFGDFKAQFELSSLAQLKMCRKVQAASGNVHRCCELRFRQISFR